MLPALRGLDASSEVSGNIASMTAICHLQTKNNHAPEVFAFAFLIPQQTHKTM
jgi:hypothetical protein